MRTTIRILVPATLVFVIGGCRAAQAQTVQAVLFYSPTCQHCHQVITQYLPTLFETYGGRPTVIYDESIPQNEQSLILFRNSQLELLLIDASKALGGELYLASNRNQQIPLERSGVPRLVIGNEYLVGSLEIPEQTGDLVRQGMEQGGLGWPAIDGLADALAFVPDLEPVVATQQQDTAAVVAGEPEDSAATQPEEPAAADSAPTIEEMPDPEPPSPDLTDSVLPAREDTAVGPSIEVAPPADVEVVEAEPDSADAISPDSVTPLREEPGDTATAVPSAFDMVPMRELSMAENFQLDPVGNSFSVVVLVFMIASVALVWLKPDVLPAKWGLGLIVPVLAVIGAGVASYLAYIEATGVTAVCGPVGDCNTVNQSEYARLFGMIPVGALGLVGYVAIILVWAASKFAPGAAALWARVSLFAMAAIGTLFSIYLTFLEPFVIGATCAWCLTSSIIMTALMWLFANEGREAWARIRSRGS